MTDSKTIVHTNPHIFVSEFIEAVRDGYLVESSNRGFVSDSILKEIVLYKNPGKVFEEKELGEFVISDYSAQNFLYELCSWVGVGAKVDIESLFWDITGVKSIRGKLYLPAEYTKEQLGDLSWNDFKEAVKTIGITGRDRNLMLTKYLQMTGQGD
jgi:hypothetical protein